MHPTSCWFWQGLSGVPFPLSSAPLQRLRLDACGMGAKGCFSASFSVLGELASCLPPTHSPHKAPTVL